MAESSSSDETVIDLTITSSSESEEKSDQAQAQIVPHTLTLFLITFHTLSFGSVDAELNCCNNVQYC